MSIHNLDMGKFCFRCKKERPLEEFSKNSTKKDGLQTWCRECTSKGRSKTRIRGRPPRHVKGRRVDSWGKALSTVEKGGSYRQRVACRVLVGLGGKCAVCGEDDPFYLSVDHIHGTSNKERRGRSSFSEAHASGFDRTKFQLLCPRCHWTKTRMREWLRSASDVSFE